MKIAVEVLEVLNNSKLENNILYLPPQQLDRKLYQSVNKVLELLGGKWDRKIKGHKFDSDVEELLNDAINFGEVVDHKKEYQFFPTPKNIVLQLIELAELNSSDCVLEPSAGEGAIADELNNFTKNVYVVELNPAMYERLAAKHQMSVNADFLQIEPNGLYDKVVMNPPFSKQQDIDHILHAFKCLKAGGILVSIVSESPFFRNNKKSIAFREWLSENNAEIIDLEPGAFKESGTMVKTRIIKVSKA
jgi:predicted RNA methylase